MITNGKKYLITTSAWFYAPDGDQYRAVWGTAKVLETKESFGFTPNRNHANWIYEIGDSDGKITIAGCQVLYAVECTERPICKIGRFIAKDEMADQPQNKIYFAE